MLTCKFRFIFYFYPPLPLESRIIGEAGIKGGGGGVGRYNNY